MLRGFSHNITPEFYGLRTLGISSLLSPQKLIHQGAYSTMSTPIPPGHQEKAVPGVGNEDRLPSMASFTPVASSQPWSPSLPVWCSGWCSWELLGLPGLELPLQV